jgi:prephenate dehydratase
MALLQCKEFFKKYPNIKLVEDKDTAQVAKRISENKLKNIAAIASDLAAEIFSLTILNKSIQTIKHNETRFVILQKI